MQTTERPPTGPARGSSPMRGVILVAVAAVLGFFVLRAIDDSGGGPTAAEIEAANATDAPADATTPGPTDTTAPAPRAPAEVVVLVANASGVQGAAGAQAEAIQAGGYNVLPAANAAEQPTTQVLATAGYEADAAALAAAIGAPPESVGAVPDPPPLDLTGANVLVLLGPDLAEG